MPTASTWTGDEEIKPAPDPLRRVQALINTLDRETGQDRLALPGDATPWLRANDLLADDAAVTEAELRVVAAVREGLHALVASNTGGPAPDPAMLVPLREVADATPMKAVIGDGGHVTVAATGTGLEAALATLLLVVEAAQRDGTWAHLKVCANDDCGWVFYDRSRNHGGTWCDMATCGNKLKNRDFRARRRSR